jgi:uncharacterized protein with HEPN domain
MKDNNVYIDLIIAACQKISKYISGLDESAFLEQSMIQSAVLMQLQVVGEMAKKLDEATKAEIEVPWKMIVGLRNLISHDYFMLELATIWKIVATDIVDLEEKLHVYLKSQGTSYLPPFSDTTPLMD